jgi:hypothetical protein
MLKYLYISRLYHIYLFDMTLSTFKTLAEYNVCIPFIEILRLVSKALDLFTFEKARRQMTY